MKNKMGSLMAALALVVAFGASCVSTSNPAPTPAPEPPQAEAPTPPTPPVDNGPIKIGFIGPLTGDTSGLGTAARAGVEIAADEINAAGGVNGRQIQVVYEDGKCNAAPATDAASKLMNVDKVVAIDGGLCSTETSAFGPAAMQNKTVVLSYCSSAPTLTGLGKYFFRSYPSDAQEAKFAAEYASSTLKAAKVAVVYSETEPSATLKAQFKQRLEELGGKVVADETLKSLAKIKEAKPDVVYAPLENDDATTLLKQFTELGIKTKIFGGKAFVDSNLQKKVSSKGDVIFGQFITPKSDEFNAKFLAKTSDADIPACVSQAYDNLKMLAQVIGQVGTDPDAMADALHGLSYKGVSGDIAFDQNGDLATAAYVVKKIEKGKEVEVKEVDGVK